jgi:hypothetical protein
MVLGLGGLLAIPKPLEEPKPMFARTRASDLAQAPCSNQTWPMIERRCQTWTATRPGDSKNEVAAKKEDVAPKKAAVASRKEEVARAPKKEELPPKKEPIESRPEPIEPPQAAATVAARWPVAPLPVYSGSNVEPVVADPAPKPAELPPQPASEALAQAQDPAPVAPRPSADRAPKPRQAEKPSREGIQVTVQTPDRSRRTITIKPTSPQDAMYYAARRNVGIGGLFAVQ